VIYHHEIKAGQTAKTPAEPGNECLAALTALPGSFLGPARVRGRLSRAVVHPPDSGVTRPQSLAYVTYVSNVSYVCPAQIMINVRYLASMPDDTINPYADESLYVQLAGIVRRLIEKGELQHLDPVPSESTLVQTYGVSRDTVRRAMALLRDEGVVFTVPHRGTYVGPRPR
jgi:GntR family transcriptional regulator